MNSIVPYKVSDNCPLVLYLLAFDHPHSLLIYIQPFAELSTEGCQLDFGQKKFVSVYFTLN